MKISTIIQTIVRQVENSAPGFFCQRPFGRENNKNRWRDMLV